MAGSGGSLRGDTLHGASITKEHVGVVGEKVIARLVEVGSGVRLSNSHTNGVGETLTKRTGGDLNTRGVVSLRVARRDAVNLTELLQVVDANLVAEQMQESILEHATVAVAARMSAIVKPAAIFYNLWLKSSYILRMLVWWYLREHEAISVDPLRVLRVEPHELVEEDVGDRGHTHRRTGVAGVGLERGIDLQSPMLSVVILMMVMTMLPCPSWRQGC